MQPEKTSLETVQQDLVDLVSRYGTLNAELPECGFSTPTKKLDPRGSDFPHDHRERHTIGGADSLRRPRRRAGRLSERDGA